MVKSTPICVAAISSTAEAPCMSDSLHQQAECLLRAMAEGKKIHKGRCTFVQDKERNLKKIVFSISTLF